MPQDAFTIRHVAGELSALLTGGKISKIIQPEKETVTLFIYTRGGTFKLDICLSALGCRMSLTKRDAEAPKTAPNFCMLLRKYVQGGEIVSITSVEYERVVFLDVLRHTEFGKENLRLCVELMGKYSNAALCRDGIILGALKTTSIGENTKRVMFSGAQYALPLSQDKIAPSDTAAVGTALLQNKGNTAKFIADNIKGVAYRTAEDICMTFGENATAEQICGYLNGNFKNPCVVLSDGKPVDFTARCRGGDTIGYATVLEAQTAYYDYILEKRAFEAAKRKLESAVIQAVKKLEKRLAVIEQKLFECRDMENLKLKGELITANLYAVKRGADKFSAVNYYDENGGIVEIALDKTLSPADNAQRYYKKYAKLKRTVAAVGVQKEETVSRLDYLSSIRAHICAAEERRDLTEISEELKDAGLIKEQQNGKKKTAAPAPFRTYVCDGYKILAGRNNIQNDRLVKSLSPEDMWLHTKNYHSSHVAVLCGGGNLPDRVLKAAAEICAYYSDGRGGGRIDVDYTQKRYVKKPRGANAGYVVYTDYRSIAVEADRHEELATEDNDV